MTILNLFEAVYVRKFLYCLEHGHHVFSLWQMILLEVNDLLVCLDPAVNFLALVFVNSVNRNQFRAALRCTGLNFLKKKIKMK